MPFGRPAAPRLRHATIAALLAAAFCAAAPAAAEPAPAAAPIALGEALTLALQQHPSIAARVGERDAAAYRVDATQWLRYPSASLNQGTDSAGRRSTTTRIELPLWTGGQISAQIDGARASLGVAQQAVVQAQQDIVNKVVAGYTEFGRASARRAVARANVAEHERLVALIGRRVASQINPPADAVQANARLMQARAEASQADAQAARARAALEQAVGRPVAEVETPQPSPLPYADVDALAQAALAFSPQLARLRAEADSARADERVRRAAVMPRVVARYDRTFGERAVRGDQFYVGIEMQTGAGLSSLASVREAQARLQSLEQSLESARRDVVESVTADWADLQAQQSQIRDMGSQAEAAGSVYESYVRQYAVGRKSWLDVLNAQRESAQARNALADSQWSALRLSLRLQAAVGQLAAASWYPGRENPL